MTPEGSSPASPWRRFAQPMAGLAVSVVSIALLIRLVDLGEVGRSLRSADLTLVALAVAVLFVSLGAKTLRWWLLLPRSSEVTYGALFSILHASMFLNNVLPLRAGDFARGAMAARLPGLSLGPVVASMLAERAIDAVVLTACFLLVAPFVARGVLVPDLTPEWPTLLAIVGGVGFVALLVAAARRYRHLVSPVWSGRLSEFGDSWRRVASTEGWAIWATTAVAWIAAFGVNVLLFHAMGIEVSPLMAVVVTCVTNLAMLVPSSPAHIGPYHAAATVTLVVAGVGASPAASFSVFSHLVNVVPVSLVGGALLALDALPRRAAPEG